MSGVSSAVHEPLVAVAFLIVEHKLPVHELQWLRPASSVVVAPGLWSTGSEVAAHGLSGLAAWGILPDQGQSLCLMYCQVDSLPPGKPLECIFKVSLI